MKCIKKHSSFIQWTLIFIRLAMKILHYYLFIISCNTIHSSYLMPIFLSCQLQTLFLVLHFYVCLRKFTNQRLTYESYLLTMMSADADPYYTGRVNQMQTAFLNFGPYASNTNPDIYTFSGNSYSLSLKAKQMSGEELTKYRSLRINITGTMIKTNNVCCFWNTIIWGSIFLFPLFFICCDWWKKIINKLYSVEMSGYEGAAQLILNSRADDVYLMVQDNLFNESKAQVLIKALERSAVRNFVFNNVAVGFNSDGSNFSDFDIYMRPIKSLGMRSDISWASKFVV